MSLYKRRTKTAKKRAWEKERDSNSVKRHKVSLDRRAERKSAIGRQTEDRVEKLLVKKLEAGELVSFVKHPANSPEDKTGKDFTVSMMVEGKTVTASFGVTISNRQVELDVPLIVIPVNMTDERIWYRICQICKQQ